MAEKQKVADSYLQTSRKCFIALAMIRSVKHMPIIKHLLAAAKQIKSIWPEI
jgi:hypothetical protein